MKVSPFSYDIRRVQWPFVALLIVIFSMVFTMELPTQVPYAPHDDGLFIRMALAIARGQWLGDAYDEFTLAKGPFHSIVLSLGYRLGFDIGSWVRSVYAASVILFISLGLARANLYQKALTAVVLLLDPWLFTHHGMRLLRDSTFNSLGLTALAFALAAIDHLPFCSSGPLSRRQEVVSLPGWLQPIRMGLAGLALGLMLITREARIVVLALAVVMLVGWFIADLRIGPWRRRLNSTLVCALVLILTMPIPLLSVALANQGRYGLAITNEFEEGAFKGLYQDLLSVQPVGSDFLSKVPVRRSTLDKLVSLAPQSELARTINSLDPLWTTYGCQQNPTICGEYGGGWFMWALRQAMFKTGSLDTPLGFQQMSNRLQQELHLLCTTPDNGLDCVPKASGYFPRPQRWGDGSRTGWRLFLTTSQTLLGLINPPLIDELSRPYVASNPGWRDARKLGVRLPRGMKLGRYDERLAVRFWLAVVLRALLLLVFFVWLLRRRGYARVAVADPGVIILALYVVMQSLVLILIQLTSFKTGAYLAMVSPFFLALLCRMMYGTAGSSARTPLVFAPLTP